MAREGIRHPGVQAALIAAVLFGAGTPLAKLLLGEVSPWMLAGLLYLGSGLGLGIFRLIRRAPRVRIARGERLPLAGAVLAGGIVAPVLMMVGLNGMPASGASLLLNLESVFTAVLAWVIFRENAGRRVVLGMSAIVAGAALLSWDGSASFSTALPALAIVGACFAWGLDNNLTRKVALNDATWLAAVKGLVAGPVNLALALLIGSALPSPAAAAGAMGIGLLSYGVSLALFIVALRHVGTARAGAYFSIAPFAGTVLAVLLGSPVTWQLVAAGLLMGLGVWLHLTERHEHTHTHEAVTHEHSHTHDDGHHDHEHDPPVAPGTRHSHPHTHEAVTHTHPHYPDSHHRHTH